jgi:AcrR family transcriptional regulator
MLPSVPKLWTETIETHRREVKDAILETTAALVAEHGLASVTMSQIAEQTGIGRATLYKYFPDVEAILVAWHDQRVARHLEHLVEVRDRSSDAGERLRDVLEAYALVSHERSHGHHGNDEHSREHHGTHHGTPRQPAGEIAALVHRREHIAGVQRRLETFMRDLLADAARAGEVRKDVPPFELARYCLHALAVAGELPTKAAVRRLVTITLAALRPPR